MNEFSRLQELTKRLKEDKTFRKKNTSELIKLIPYIGGFIEANTLGKERDEALMGRLNVLEEIAHKAASKENLNDVINVLEQHTLILNRLVFEYKETLFKDKEINVSKVKVAISFVEQDYEIASKIAKQLKENGIEVISNNHQLVLEIGLTFNKELTPDTEGLIVIYTSNYEKFNSSSYSNETLLNNAYNKKAQIFTIAFDEIADTQLPIYNTFQKVFNRKDIDDLIPTFFFDKFIELKEVEQELLKKYSDVETILKIYNSGFKKVEESSKNNIGFELYELEQLTGKSIFCLYLYDNINYKKTIEFIRNLDSKVDILSDTFVLIKRSKKYDEEKRIARIKSYLKKDVKIIHIDNFVWDKLTSHYFERVKPEQDNTYVQPFFLFQDKKFDNFNFFENWLYKNNPPTLIITGSGGIGKSALATILTDKINNTDDNTKAIYIDALKISSTIHHLSQNDDAIDLYDFYEASLAKNTSGNKIDYELFRINVDNGNFVIIIDGLDEIISRLGERFDVEEFFNSIQNFSKGIGNGKVILTSRNYFWNKSKSPEFNIQSIEILPFDKTKAHEFFSRRYPNSPKIPQKAISIAESITGKDNDEYIPYVLECVAFIIDDTVENGNYYDPDFNSEILNQHIKNDFILGKLCVREEQRTEQVSVDNQIKLFFEVALTSLMKDDLKGVCERVLKDSINERQIETFLAHPLIDLKKNQIVFKYDFFKNHIKNIYFNLLLEGKSSLNNHHIDILSNYISYNSSFTNDLCERINVSLETLEFRILELIEAIKSDTSINQKSKRRAISSLFIIMLKLVHKHNNSNIEVNTNILKQIFETTKDNIDELFIIDLSCNDNNKIVFDFSDLEISNSFISSYDYFWNCKFNENTKFKDSYFYSLYLERNINTLADSSHFINVKGSDDSFKSVINKVSQKSENKDHKIILDLHQFLSFFCKNGNIERRILPKVTSYYQCGAVDLNTMIKVLSKENVISTYRSSAGNETIEINKDYKSDILKFHSNRLSVGIIKTLFEKLKERTK